MGGVGLFVFGLGLGVVIMLFGVMFVITTDYKWISILSAAISGLVVAGICILVSRYSLKMQVEEFKTAKVVYGVNRRR